MTSNMSTIQPNTTPETETREPPLPKQLYVIINPLMAAILRSPLHGLISKSLMLLIYEGRKSGKRYIIPVGYVPQGNRLYVFTHSPWWKNFAQSAPVAMRLQGKLVRGTATRTDDAAIIETVVRQMVADRGEAMAERMGLMSDGAVAPRGMVFIEIVLEEQA